MFKCSNLYKEYAMNNNEVLNGAPLQEEKLFALADFYKVLGEPSRLKILYCLYGKELSVSEIASGVGSTVSAVSHQLKILKNARLVKYRKEGKNSIYSLADDHISTILSMGTDHINE
ncbi:MAG: helix-turn-helix transcriptional regulator [Clostridia bacterium]|nr:helix-turn-helix transcriptional regulator [Clostridia bacterium]